MKLFVISALTAGALFMTASAAEAKPHKLYAQSGWVLNARKCPDLMEDRRDRRESRRDERYDHNRRDVREDRRDRRESRRDEAIINCPAKAWSWQGPRNRHYNKNKRPKAVYFDRNSSVYFFHNTYGNRVVIKF